jgi:hypothetical protein
MNGKKAAGIILLTFGIAGVLAALMVFYLHSDLQRAQEIASYMKYKYGVATDDSVGVKLNGDEFTLMTADGIMVNGTCDYFGRIKTDSYVNYYYADECVEHIRKKIGDCFSDSLIVYDGINLSELASITMETRSINSYDEYVTATRNAWENADKHKYYYKISIRVYIRESEYTGNVYDALAKLLDSEEYFDVFFYAIPDELFDLHKEKGIYAYFKGRTFDELDDYLDKETAEELKDLIYYQNGLVDEYYLWRRNAIPGNDDIELGTGAMLVISSTIEGPIDYYDDDRLLGVVYTINWNGTITKRSQYQSTGYIAEGTVSVHADDFHKFYNFAEYAYKNDPYKDYSENVMDGSTYGFVYYPAESSDRAVLYGGYCYDNEELWGMVELARSYFE